jgi:hypothetical protein
MVASNMAKLMFFKSINDMKGIKSSCAPFINSSLEVNPPYTGHPTTKNT